MGRIPEQVVAEIRERADIAQVVGRHVTLKKSGSRLWGLCPFHDEKTPSFQVHEDKQIFYCFGCGAGGDVFAFRMKHEGLDFPDAVRVLGRELGIAIPEERGEEGKASAIYRANEAACSFFRAELRGPHGAAGRKYLAERSVPEDLVDRFRVGFAPAAWDGLVSHLRRAGIAPADAELAGLIARRQTGDGHYDRFRGRVVFPITDPSGQIAGFGGRAMGDDVPKYLNSPESPVYKKSRVLFGITQALDAIRERGRVIVVEGYFDLLALHRAGLHEGVAPCGTALTQSHAHRIRRYAEEVVLLFDGDTAGRVAAERALPILLAEQLRVKAAFLPLGEDPDTLVAKSGVAALRAYVDGAVLLLDYLAEQVLKNDAVEQADRARAVAPYLRAIVDPVERAAWVRTFASKLEIPPAALDQALREAQSRSTSTTHTITARAGATARPAAREPEPAVRGILVDLMAHPRVAAHCAGLDLAWVAAGPARELLARLLQGDAVAALLSPDCDLPDAERELLLQLVPATPSATPEIAERCVSDCIATLEIGAQKRALAELVKRSGSCTDRAQLDEEELRLRSRIHDLEKRRRHL